MPLEYDRPVYRPPVEAYSLILQPTIGCPHNKCTFCFAYKSKKFKIKKMYEIKADIAKALKAYGSNFEKIFLADGNTIAMRTDQQVEMLTTIKEAFPHVSQIASYAGAKFVLKKSLEDLKKIRHAGLTKVYVGVESGDPIILGKICKDVTAEDTLTACLRLKKADFLLSTTIVMGLGGKERWKEHALETAKLLNKIQPDELRLHTLMLKPGTQLYEEMKNSKFEVSNPKEIFQETRLLVQNLEIDCILYSHGSNYLLLQGRLPNDKQYFLETIDSVFTNEGEMALRETGILQDERDRIL